MLAHERAHLAGQHHRCSRDPLAGGDRPGRPALQRAGTAEVARLAEMRADDVAGPRTGGEQGRRTLLTALLAMAHGAGAGAWACQPPGCPLAGGAVAARVRGSPSRRHPPGRCAYGLALSAGTLAITAVAGLLPVLAVTGTWWVP